MLRQYQYEVVRHLINKTKRHYIGCLPRSSGKSFLGLYIANARICKDYDKTQHWAIIAKEKAQAKDIYVKNIMFNGKELFSILPKFCKYSKYESEIKYSNGSTIKFFGADSIETIRGMRFDGIIGDEVASWKEDAFNVLYPCLREDDYSSLIMISTIRGKNHFYRLMQQQINSHQWIVQHESVFSLNLMTQQQFDENPLEINFKMQEYMCDPEASFVGSVYAKPNIIPNIRYNNMHKLYGAIDIGQKDSMAVGLAQFINNEIHFLYSFEINNTSLEDVVSIIKSYLDKISCKLENFLLFVPHDASVRDTWTGISRKSNIQNSGIAIHQLPRAGLLDSIDYVRRCWHVIFFDESNNQVCIERIKAYTVNPNTQIPNHDKNSHCADMVRYMTMGYKILTNNYINMNKYVTYNRII